MAKKGVAVKVRLVSEAGTGYTYYAKRSARAEYKLEQRKFDPRAVNEKTGKKGAHVTFKEKKMPPSKKN